MKTPQDYRRDDIRQLFSRRLGEDIIKLSPMSLKVEESISREKTIIDFSFEKTENKVKNDYKFLEVPGSGFLDAIYKACHNTFVGDFNSLANLSLVDVIIKPIFAMSSTNAKTDAKTNVSLRLRTKQHGISEFSSISRSIVYSSFVSMLSAFQFYMNCDKTFKVLKFVLEDAQSRNRGDIAQQCWSDMAVLTRVNTYD